MENQEQRNLNIQLSIQSQDSQSVSYFFKQENLLNEKFLTDLTNEFRNLGVKFGEEYQNFVNIFLSLFKNT